jgi:hypothetical protein
MGLHTSERPILSTAARIEQRIDAFPLANAEPSSPTDCLIRSWPIASMVERTTISSGS